MIDLGQKNSSGPCCAPMSTDSESKVHYPNLYFTTDTEIEFPDDGTAVIKFRKVECSENMRDPKDPKYRYELEVQGIDIKGAEVEEEDMGKKAMKGIKMMMDKKKESY